MLAATNWRLPKQFQSKTQSELLDFVSKKFSYDPPVTDSTNEVHMINGKDVNSLPGDAPPTYGRNVARVLWTRDELIQGILSPGKDMAFMSSPRADLSPTRKTIFRGK